MDPNNSRLMTLASNVKLFNGVPMNLLGKLISFADKVDIVEGLTFFNEGDSGDSFYILIIGHAVVEQTKHGKWVQLAALHPGDSFGEMILVDDKVRSARVRATSDCVALNFSLQRLKAAPEIMVSLFQNIAKILAKRLKSTNNVVLELHQRAKDAERGALPPPSQDMIDAMKKADETGEFVSYEKKEDEDVGATAGADEAPVPEATAAEVAALEFDVPEGADPSAALARRQGDSSIPELRLHAKQGNKAY
jgi:CRP/FNR family cyclic AMP-dependent transcriptional regulator